MAETAHGGPFPEVLEHEIFLNCILATPGVPVFVPRSARLTSPARFGVIGDIACDPTSDFSPVKVYDAVTDWETPARRVHDDPPLDVMAIDNLPSLLPRESSEDYAAQLLPSLLALARSAKGSGPARMRIRTPRRQRSGRLFILAENSGGAAGGGRAPRRRPPHIRSSSSSVMSKPIASAPASRWSAKCGLPSR
jgi:hypothetical protein